MNQVELDQVVRDRVAAKRDAVQVPRDLSTRIMRALAGAPTAEDSGSGAAQEIRRGIRTSTPVRPLGRLVARELLLASAMFAFVTLLAGGAVWLRSQSHPAGHPTPSPSPTSTPSPLPAAVVDAAGLANVAKLITLEHVQVQLGNTRLTVLGTYADPARTIVFYEVIPEGNSVSVDLYDAHGPMGLPPNYWVSGGGRRVAGLRFLWRDAGLKVASDGLAHATIEAYVPPPGAGGGKALATARLPITLRVQGAKSLPRPSPFRAGSWTVTVEKLEVTPAAVHLQAVIAGATLQTIDAGCIPGPGECQAVTVALVDVAGRPLQEASLSGDQNTMTPRVNFQWVRPTVAGKYQLRIAAPGGTGTITIDLPALSG